ncbi:MAG: PaaI family thioesterase [Thermodesulfobacteriota bacterium]
MSTKAFQDYWQHNECWGCGCSNEHGLNIKSYWDDDKSVCVWTPNQNHKAGPSGFLNGGIIASIMDCHSVSTAIADAYKLEERELNSEPIIWYVTASLKIDYHKPTPIDKDVSLKAKVTMREGRKLLVVCKLFSGEEKCASAEVLAVKVPPENWFD